MVNNVLGTDSKPQRAIYITKTHHKNNIWLSFTVSDNNSDCKNSLVLPVQQNCLEWRMIGTNSIVYVIGNESDDTAMDGME